MKKLRFISSLAMLLFIALVSSCEVDDPFVEAPKPEELIVGEWVSEGTDLAFAFQDIVSKMTLTFSSSLGYTLTETGLNGVSSTSSGTFSIPTQGVSGSIYPIKFQQSISSSATFEGICELVIYTSSQADELTLEIVRTFPSSGFLPASIEEGFGSTDGGSQGVDLIQKYRREK